MNRTERLYALVEVLRSRSPRLTRAIDLAARFEITTRTIERDLLALQIAGVPVWAQPGPGGGYGVDIDATLPPLNLTSAEAAAIATGLAATSSMPFPEAGRSALRKLTAVMAPAPRNDASRLVSRVRVSPRARTSDPQSAATILRALMASIAIELSYKDANGRRTCRIVEPVGVFNTSHGWYLAAWCRERGAYRAFRLDRIGDARLTGEVIPGRSLESALAGIPLEFIQPGLG